MISELVTLLVSWKVYLIWRDFGSLEIKRKTNSGLGYSCFVRRRFLFESIEVHWAVGVTGRCERSLSERVEPIGAPVDGSVGGSAKGIGLEAYFVFGSSSFQEIWRGCTAAASDGCRLGSLHKNLDFR